MKIYFWPKKRLLPLLLLLAVALSLLTLPRSLPAVAAWAQLLPLQQPRQVPVYQVDTRQQAVAISFDASWGAEHTPEILEVLERYGVSTTFFLVNIWLEDYPEQAKEIVARGHEIGLHSVSHPDMTTLSTEQVCAELNGNARMIQDITGFTPTLFRCPFGAYNDTVVNTCRDCGYTCVQWSIDSLDWQELSADEIVERVCRDVQAGDIILFHNNGLHTAEALPRVLEHLQTQQLAVVPVSQLLLPGDCYVDNNGVQHAKTVAEADGEEQTNL